MTASCERTGRACAARMAAGECHPPSASARRECFESVQYHHMSAGRCRLARDATAGPCPSVPLSLCPSFDHQAASACREIAFVLVSGNPLSIRDFYRVLARAGSRRVKIPVRCDRAGCS